ncbi:MAG: glutathione S-transferase family protein [Pseudomonadota bacterium]
MVHLNIEDVRTTEVFDWKGLHLLHFAGSSCSQKARIFLNLKGVDWTSHHVDLVKSENLSDWFMGINPRGLVPVLVDDGQVIIESNDILLHVEEKHPNPKLIPTDKDDEMRALLEAEDDLHLDLRAISMRYVFGRNMGRTEEQEAAYENAGAGTVNGVEDPQKAVQIKFFKDMTANGGITDEQIVEAGRRFKDTLDEFDARLAASANLMGEDVSLIDIAWYIYAGRLVHAGYPLHRLHPKVGAWFDTLDAKPEFNREVMMPPPLIAMRDALHAEQKKNGASLEMVAGL